jgi:signal transduction histidine kinase
MRFPPPIRITAPLLALVFGLGATWLDYRLNLESDLGRPLRVMRTRADLNGRHLARLSEELLARSQRDALEEDLKTRVDSSQLKIAGVVDQSGRIVADSTGKLRGQVAASTPLAVAAALINQTGQAVVSHDVGMGAVISAHPFRIGERDRGWVLLEFDITEVVAAARADARVQLGWMALAMSLLSLTLWVVLHFGFAARLGRLADSVQAFGEGRMDAASLPEGRELAHAFSTMAAKLHEREIEQFRLEHEVLEISESERRRIGHDLHDGLGQRLTAASMGLNALVAALKAENAPALAERGEDIGRQIREAIAETRSLSHGLAPVALVDDGLMNALVSLAEGTSRGGTVRCVFECPEPICVAEAEVADHLYRIAQEAVNNAVKHAAPSEIRIGLERQNGALVLEVDDDGEGLNESAPLATGIGLRVMRYRARLIGGDLEIGSPPAGGTRVCCRVKLDT